MQTSQSRDNAVNNTTVLSHAVTFIKSIFNELNDPNVTDRISDKQLDSDTVDTFIIAALRKKIHDNVKGLK